MMTFESKPVVAPGKVYCPSCTHTVDARVVQTPRRAVVEPGQRCPRCSGSLDAGYILQLSLAA